MRSIPSVLVLTFLAGCGAGPTTASDADADTGGERLAIAGRWSSPCVPTDTGALRLRFDIDEARWALDYDTFADAACGTPFLTVHIEGPYEIAGPSAVAGASEARFGFDVKSVTPHGEGAVGFLAGLGDACGGPGTWSDGVARDVLASGCLPLGQRAGEACPADYDLVALVDGALHFGERPADNDMCTPDRRPSALSPLGMIRE